MKNKSSKINHSFKGLFWDYKFEDVLSNLDNDVVIARVLELGDIEDFKFLKQNVSDEKIIDFLKRRGEKLLSKISFNFWSIYFGIK
ncbi:MAG: DUF6922 domain-containing protein [Caldisericia bacterium]